MDTPEPKDFFNHWWKPGLLSQMLYAAHERERHVIPDSNLLIAIFEAHQLHGMAKMTRYIKKNPNISVIGSSTVSMNPDDHSEMNMEKFMELHEFHLGDVRLRLLPMQHLYHLANMLDDLPGEVKTLLDRVFNALASVTEGEVMESFPEDDLAQVSFEDLLKSDSKKPH